MVDPRSYQKTRKPQILLFMGPVCQLNRASCLQTSPLGDEWKTLLSGVQVGVSGKFSEGWLAALTLATLSDLSFVPSHPGPLTLHPLSPQSHQQKELMDKEEEVGGLLFY